MKIRELFSDESKWTKGTFARTADGIPCFTSHPEAVCFCIEGAIARCYAPTEILTASKDAIRVRESIVAAIAPADTYRWNDDPSRTFAEVKALVERLDV